MYIACNYTVVYTVSVVRCKRPCGCETSFTAIDTCYEPTGAGSGPGWGAVVGWRNEAFFFWLLPSACALPCSCALSFCLCILCTHTHTPTPQHTPSCSEWAVVRTAECDAMHVPPRASLSLPYRTHTVIYRTYYNVQCIQYVLDKYFFCTWYRTTYIQGRRWRRERPVTVRRDRDEMR